MVFTDLNEEKLIVLLYQKDIAAFEYVYDKYAASIYGHLKLDAANAEQAEQALMDVFVLFWNKLDTKPNLNMGLFIYLYRLSTKIIRK